MTDLERWQRWKANPSIENRDAFLEPYLRMAPKEERGVVWLALVKTLEKWNPEIASFGTFAQLKIKAYAHRARLDSYSDALFEFDEPPTFDVGDDLDLLRDLLRGYKYRDRYIVIAHICGDDVETIAQTVGRSISTVYNVLNRMREKLLARGFKPMDAKKANRLRTKERYYQMTQEERDATREKARLYREEHLERYQMQKHEYYLKNRDAILLRNKIGKRRYAKQVANY